MNAKNIPGVPQQKNGAFHDTESCREFASETETLQSFAKLRERFFSVNRWKEYCGPASADFKLYDASGNYVDRPPRLGDYMRIDIPGPGDPQAGGYDWVQVTDYDETVSGTSEFERCLITCRPAPVPRSKTTVPAHFYARESSSTFIISRGKFFIKAAIHGRNEVANKKEESFWGTIRNFIVTLGGMIKVTKMQWKSLSDGLLEG